MYVLFIGLCILLPAGLAHAQQPTILICATDASNNRDLSGADVKIITAETTFSGVTGRSGCIYLSGASPVGIGGDLNTTPALKTGVAYPNPAGARVAVPVVTTRPHAVTFSVYDALGRQLDIPATRSLTTEGILFDVDLAGLADGLYVYRIAGPDGAVQHGKFMRRQSAAGSPTLSATSARPGSRVQVIQQADSVTVEIAKDGFVTLTERRVLSRFDQLTYRVLKATTDLIPLMDMQGVRYLGRYGGGLYPNETNELPAAHLAAGLSRAATIEPLDINGNPSANGYIVMTSIGMSTTSSMFCGVADASEPCKEGTFIRTLTTESGLHPRLRVVDGADPGKTTEKWELPEDKTYDRVRDEELIPFGLSEAQIQVAWVNLASASPTVSLPDAAADAALMEQQYGNVLRAMQTRYPNLKLVFFSSRVYGGYATTSPINPEPYAYESGFAVKWVIEAQLNQMHGSAAQIDVEAGNLDFNAVAPWISWGEYLWADGANPRSDGLVWLPEDLKDDGTHLQRVGIEKVTAILLDFFRTSRLTRCWFLENGEVCG
ncbi:MAG: T9SS type A sorting domain-containing protein [Bacteroidota bacterium]